MKPYQNILVGVNYPPASELATLGRTGAGLKVFKRNHLGGTAETLIRHVHCYVLGVPIIS